MSGINFPEDRQQLEIFKIKLPIAQNNVNRGKTEVSLFGQKIGEAGDLVSITEMGLDNANKIVIETKQSTKELEQTVDSMNSRLEGLKGQLEQANDEQKPALQEQITNLEKQLEAKQKELEDSRNAEKAAVDNQQQAEANVNTAKTTLQDETNNLNNAETQLGDNQSELNNLTEQKTNLEAKIASEENNQPKETNGKEVTDKVLKDIGWSGNNLEKDLEILDMLKKDGYNIESKKAELEARIKVQDDKGQKATEWLKGHHNDAYEEVMNNKKTAYDSKADKVTVDNKENNKTLTKEEVNKAGWTGNNMEKDLELLADF